MKRLQYKEFVPFAPSEEGTVRVNHESNDCSGGRQSMKITRKDNGNIDAYCFRCGKSGYLANNTVGSKTANSRAKKLNNGSQFGGARDSLPRDTEHNIENWPIEARLWIRGTTLNDSDVRDYGIGFSREEQRVVIPLYSYEGSFAGYIARRIYYDDSLPKYLDRSKGKDSVKIFTEKTNYVIIVEDILSYYVISKNHSCLCLMGTKLSVKQLALLMPYSTFIVWLDDDNSIVKKIQAELMKRLSLFGKVYILKTDKDPKQYDDSEINTLISDLLKGK